MGFWTKIKVYKKPVTWEIYVLFPGNLLLGIYITVTETQKTDINIKKYLYHNYKNVGLQ